MIAERFWMFLFLASGLWLCCRALQIWSINLLAGSRASAEESFKRMGHQNHPLLGDPPKGPRKSNGFALVLALLGFAFGMYGVHLSKKVRAEQQSQQPAGVEQTR